MRSVIGTKIDLDDFSSNAAHEFLACVSDLIGNDMVQELDDFKQHMDTTRLQHSLNVAYYSYMACKLLGLDYVSAARAGLLHDLFLYDWRDDLAAPDGNHALAHPRVALENAHTIAAINIREADAIAKHMWPLCASVPRYRESFIVCFADKYCATAEICAHFSSLLKKKLRRAAYEN